MNGCILSKFYIKPQLPRQKDSYYRCCILSKFYIKPQPLARVRELLEVVSYRNSTSNHNSLTTRYDSRGVVSYRNSTSNHNSRAASTISAGLYLIEILHQTTTGIATGWKRFLLYLIEILHQTTTRGRRNRRYYSCILSKFYIKPQRIPQCFVFQVSCILSKFYIKPQPSGLILIDKVLLTGCLPL